jgi:hypothetical protein
MTIIILTALLGGLCFLLGAASFEADVRRAGEEDAPPTPKELP